MKRIACLILSFVIILVTLLGCSNPADESPTDLTEPDTATNTSNEKIIMKLGDVLSEDHPHSKAQYYFAERMAELTDGRVEVQVFINGALGDSRDLVEGIKLGTVQFTKSMTTILSSYFPEIQIFDLPYMFSGREHFYKVLDSEIGEYFLKEKLAEEDFLGLCFFDAGNRSIYTVDKPVTKIEDVKGMKLRVPESPIFMAMMDAFGGTGTPMPVGDIYTSLQTGIIDGAENAPVFYELQKHYEAAPNFCLTEHMMTPDIIIMSKSYFESLDADIQEAIIIAANEMSQFEREEWQKLEATTIDTLKEKGVNIVEVDKTGFIEASEVVWEKFNDVVDQDMIKKIQALK